MPSVCSSIVDLGLIAKTVSDLETLLVKGKRAKQRLDSNPSKVYLYARRPSKPWY
jgi:hypothetical protein